MSIIVILSDHVSSHNVLASKLRLKRYTDIRLKGEKYGDILYRSLNVLKKKPPILMYDKPDVSPRMKDLANFIKLSKVIVTPQTRVLFINLSYYICDFQTIDVVLQKMTMVDGAVHCSVNRAPIGWFCVPFSTISTNIGNPSSLVASQSDHTLPIDKYVLNLQEPKVLLDLFASSFDTRHFNHIEQDDVYFIKTSTSNEKMKREYDFFTGLPLQLKPFFPQVGEYQSKGTVSSYQIERVFAFNASTLLIHNAINPDVFLRLLDMIAFYLKRCNENTNDHKDTKAIYSMYFVEKVRARFEVFKTLPCFEKINRLWVHYSKKSCQDYMTEFLETMEKAIQKASHPKLVFSHGDLCLSNILFDIETGSIKLIDPRGKQDSDGYELPEAYDLAKLSHSILGGYDYIMAGYADIRVTKDLVIEQRFRSLPVYDEVLKQLFSKWASARIPLPFLRLCEASLFFSMSPLHSDHSSHILSHWISGDKAYKYFLDHQ